MSTVKIALDRLETRLQTLVEGSAPRIFSDRVPLQELSDRLLEAMRSAVQSGQEQDSASPNLLVIVLPPDQTELLQADQALLGKLEQALRETASDIGMDSSFPLSLQVEADPGLSPGELRVIPRNNLEDLSPTYGVEISIDEGVGAVPENAFLIVDGTRVVPLDQVVVNIGRRPDNHLVIDDLRVSRLHAQLRAVQGRYVIFDLDSAGGTWVNGKRVTQQTLLPGDVISLSGLPMVFGQDSQELGETQEYIPPS
jgi:hypothetical protein